MELQTLQNNLGYFFKNIDLLNQSLVHRSYLNENRNIYSHSNERLEFLGDAVLELWTTNYLYLNFPELEEGSLTNQRSLAVRTENLAEIAKQIDLGQFIFLSHGEEKHQGRDNISILADTFESILGAIYLDSGFNSIDQVLTKLLTPSLIKIANQKNIKDPKSYFQELAQKKTNITPHYQTISESGPDHQKVFTVGLYIGDQQISTGKGNSKQKAEESAALSGIDSFKN
ncbi:MAG TPA: ribonuclease III [Candidatus Woesebacteria bacterium]|nr:ribonuclease III [Candidatus Woesebacteria bacterium]HPJ17129.1 ribonuclease III [Candidatus Woesebacteria bacterium]